MRWQIQAEEIPQSSTDIMRILAKNRGLLNHQELATFLDPVHPNQITATEVGFSEQQLTNAQEILHKAKLQKKPIVICGDYDADGISATAVLWQVLNAGGWQVQPFIPDRQKHGYGLSHSAIDDILVMEPKPEIVITVDNGIVAHEPTQRLMDNGLEVIITDHHQPEKDVQGKVTLPPASSVVYSTALCGTTVAWMFGRELGKYMTESGSDVAAEDHMALVTEQTIDIAGLATIADQVPLLSYNRSFAWHGLVALQHTQRPGILALLESAHSTQEDLNETTVSFRIAPRINAMGRLEHGMDALRLLCTKKIAKARELAAILNQTNARRQDFTIDQYELAKQQAQKQQEQHVIVVHAPDFHEGIIGLIAGRLVEEFGKPAIVISSGDAETDHAKASARSLQGINIVELIREVRHDLLEVGGHPMAAGFGLLTGKIQTITEQLHELAIRTIQKEDLVPTLVVEAQITPDLLTLDSYDVVQSFRPFGQKNPEPLWLVEFDQVLDVKMMGANNQHCKVKLFDSNTGVQIDGLCWNLAEQVQEKLQIAGQLSTGSKPIFQVVCAFDKNVWKGRAKSQLRVADIRAIIPQKQVKDVM
jgi:single-stranded-DNA-specific exonuclease